MCIPEEAEDRQTCPAQHQSSQRPGNREQNRTVGTAYWVAGAENNQLTKLVHAQNGAKVSTKNSTLGIAEQRRIRK